LASGLAVGDEVGLLLGELDGDLVVVVGVAVGLADGALVGVFDGDLEGDKVTPSHSEQATQSVVLATQALYLVSRLVQPSKLNNTLI